MKLKKWSNQEVKSSITEDLLETELIQLIVSLSEQQKAFGVYWDTGQDTLHVAMPTLDSDSPPIKRCVLSDIARTFDFLVWFCPLTISLKALLQHIWKLELG